MRPRFLISNFLVALSLQAIFTVTLFLKAEGSTVSDLSKSTGLFFSTKAIASFLGIISYCIFAANFAQEYGYGTLKNLLVRQPNRSKLIIGKILAVATFMAVLVLLVALLGGGLAYALSSHAHVETTSWNFFNSEFLAPLLNVEVAAIAYGVIGACLAVILRSSITAISAGLVWLLVIETLFGFFGKSLTKWLPGGNLANFADGGSAEMSYLHSATIVGGYTVVSLALLTIIFNLRDVAN
jgi:ABC-type transport system involved in multi-copper enzyme maturation permease subunit